MIQSFWSRWRVEWGFWFNPWRALTPVGVLANLRVLNNIFIKSAIYFSSIKFPFKNFTNFCENFLKNFENVFLLKGPAPVIVWRLIWGPPPLEVNLNLLKRLVETDADILNVSQVAEDRVIALDNALDVSFSAFFQTVSKNVSKITYIWKIFQKQVERI